MTRPTIRLGCETLEDRTTPTAIPSLATGAAAGQPPEVQVYDAAGTELTRFLAYAADFTGGITVALGDVTGDGTPDIVTAPKAGGASNVRVFDGTTFSLVRSYYAFDKTFTGGVNLATADLTGNAADDIVVGAGAGGGPQVKVFDGATGELAKSFYAFDPSFRGGVNVAAKPVVVTTTNYGPVWVPNDGPAVDLPPGTLFFEGNYHLESKAPTMTRTSGRIIAGAGTGGGPQVSVFDADTLAVQQSFYAYDPGFRGGVNVAAQGTVIYTGAGDGGGSNVRFFVRPDSASLYELRASFFAGTAADVHGVTVGADEQGLVALLPNGDGPSAVKTFSVTTAYTDNVLATTTVTDTTYAPILPAPGKFGSFGRKLLVRAVPVAPPPLAQGLSPTPPGLIPNPPQS